MMKSTKEVFLLAILISGFNLGVTKGFAQCANAANIYTFEYNGHSYELVKENQTWTSAVNCAVVRGGYLAEINDAAEQEAIFDELVNNAGISISNTQNQFGTASVWLGGSDAVAEGSWIWDGNNSGTGAPFWTGGPNGMSVGGAYTNWGTSPAEPDNSGGQDHLTLIIKPTAVNFGLWNDLIATNSLYYLIEYNTILAVKETELRGKLRLFPNPFQNIISIENNNNVAIAGIEIINILNQKTEQIQLEEIRNNEINVSGLAKGAYILNIRFENGVVLNHKMVK